MHSDISARSRALKRESQQLLGLGDHLNALRKISKAIAMATKEPIDFQIGLLNLRAEALIKHAKLNLALVDAKAMITLDPSSDAGYLRAGQILRLLQRADDAAGNYRLGLERAADKTRLWPVSS